MNTFGRVITAMVTPFGADGIIDYQRLSRLIEHLVQNGTDSLVVSGTTGESPTLSKKEKLELFEKTSELANGRMKVIANAGNNNTADSVSFVEEIERLNAVDGILAVNPYYNKPSQEGLFQHFKHMAEATSLPVMLYNIPGRTSVNLNADTTLRLSEIPNIFAIKESSGNLSQMAEIIEHSSDQFYVYSGDDNLTLPVLSLGGYGVVSVASHMVGLDIQQMIRSFLNGDVVSSAAIHRKLLPFFEGIFFRTNPVPIKEILTFAGIETGGVRLPLVGLNEDEKKIAYELYQSILQKSC